VLAAGDFTLTEVGIDSRTGARTYQVTNHGLPITDLGVNAVDPQTGQPARVYLTPDIHHARIGTGETMTFKAVPIFGPEDVLNSPHPNGGHYVVSTGVELGVALDDVTVYVCAGSQEEAEQIADELYGFTPEPTQLSIAIQSPTEGSTFDMAATTDILLMTMLH